MNKYTRRDRGRFRLKRPLNIVFALALSGCLFRPGFEDWTPQEQQEKVADYAAQGGYNSSHSHKVSTLRETWQNGADALNVAFSVPEAPGTYPLIVYLPGLGEAATAGELWIKAWAAAGYAVFSVQSVELAEALKSLPPPGKRNKPGAWSFGGKPDLDDTQAVRDSELHYLGRSYFSADALHKRLQLTAWALQKLQALSRDTTSRFAAADLSHSVVAGYELGAQTAAALAGESIGQAVPNLSGWRPQALIALSPTVDLAAGGVRERFKHLTVPLLAVTGPADSDPYGVGSASLRSALWDYAASAEKYLLLLQGAPHELFAGSNRPLHLDELMPDEEDDDEFADGYSQLTQNYRSGTNPGGPPPGMFMSRPAAHRPDKEQLLRQMADIRCVTLAFLDATIKVDDSARQWLNDKAAGWIGKWAELKAYRK